MLVDLLEFATKHLVDDGRLSFWMPTANDEDVYLAIPTHPSLDLVSVCVQSFNKCQPIFPPQITLSFPLTPIHPTRVKKTPHISKTSRQYKQYHRTRNLSHQQRNRNQGPHRQRPQFVPEKGTYNPQSFPFPFSPSSSTNLILTNPSPPKQYFQGFKTSSPDDETVPNSEPIQTHP